ncbi:hypothetical protein [Gilvimarinus algae]|uniref:HEAT repeat domain-containing protein n=1 Tax=Gilvimarinus algae TaxID=3058037 RepID=A0ABT8TEF7_9GAMM|nr:hypothetical protein [Gilvimarinus sp. SDUM040014]MDO3381924.1 hypothetical protein [Gilvimarinus sp. SDUM040014]
MQTLRFTLFITLFVSFFSLAEEPLSPVAENYIERLAKGGPSTVRDVAKSMYRSKETDPRVLDVAAEVLMRDYQSAFDRTEIDALAWVVNALSLAQTNRYQPILAEVEENASHKKLSKYARKRQDDDLPVDQPFILGTVDLAALAGEEAVAKPAPSAAASVEPSGKEYHPITVIREGMSMQEAFDLAGAPTSKHAYQTGKNWIPFNYKGGDIRRQDALYKGQGRIVFSNTSRYSDSWRVLEVVEDASESGYP